MEKLINKAAIVILTPIFMFLSIASIASFVVFDIRYFSLAEWDGFCRFLLVVFSTSAVFCVWSEYEIKEYSLEIRKYGLPEVSTDAPMPKCKPTKPTREE